MALTDSLRILITANGAQAEREFAKVGAAARTNMGAAQTSSQRFGRNLVSAGAAVAGFAGVAIYGLTAAARAAEEEDLQIARLNNSIANSPTLVGASTDAFLEQAAALQDTTKYADDATIGVQAMLATFRLTQDQILQLTPLVEDVASKFGVDVERAAVNVGKAMQGSRSSLQRWGIIIDEDAYAANRFSAVIDGLRENAGGFAATEGDSFSGQLAILRNHFGDVVEEVGRNVTPALEGFIDALDEALPLLERFAPALQGMSEDSAGFAADTTDAVSTLVNLATGAADAADSLGPLKDIFGELMQNLNPVGAASNFRGIFQSIADNDIVGNALDVQYFGRVLNDTGLEGKEAGEDIADGFGLAGDAVSRLGREWDGIAGRLSNFDAVVGAQQALYGFRDALASAQEEGGITAEEMVGLNGELSRLVDSQLELATAQATAADGTVSYGKRNRILRQQLGSLASFIPAQLRPQFEFLTQDIENVPTSHDTELTLHANADITAALSGLATLEGHIRDVAIAYQSADFNRGQALTGGSTPTQSPGNQPRTRESAVTEDGIGRAVARHLQSTVQPMVLVGSN